MPLPHARGWTSSLNRWHRWQSQRCRHAGNLYAAASVGRRCRGLRAPILPPIGSIRAPGCRAAARFSAFPPGQATMPAPCLRSTSTGRARSPIWGIRRSNRRITIQRRCSRRTRSSRSTKMATPGSWISAGRHRPSRRQVASARTAPGRTLPISPTAPSC